MNYNRSTKVNDRNWCLRIIRISIVISCKSKNFFIQVLQKKLKFAARRVGCATATGGHHRRPVCRRARPDSATTDYTVSEQSVMFFTRYNITRLFKLFSIFISNLVLNKWKYCSIFKFIFSRSNSSWFKN